MKIEIRYIFCCGLIILLFAIQFLLLILLSYLTGYNFSVRFINLTFNLFDELIRVGVSFLMLGFALKIFEIKSVTLNK